MQVFGTLDEIYESETDKKFFIALKRMPELCS